MTQYTILRALAAQGPLTINELAELLVMDRTTLGHNIKPLNRDGFITIERSEQDLRVKVVILTAAGQHVVDKSYHAWKAAQDQFEREYGAKSANEMREAMRMVTRTQLPLE